MLQLSININILGTIIYIYINTGCLSPEWERTGRGDWPPRRITTGGEFLRGMVGILLWNINGIE